MLFLLSNPLLSESNCIGKLEEINIICYKNKKLGDSTYSMLDLIPIVNRKNELLIEQLERASVTLYV